MVIFHSYVKLPEGNGLFSLSLKISSIIFQLVGGFSPATPLKNDGVRHLGLLFQIDGKKTIFQTTNIFQHTLWLCQNSY